MDTKSKSDVRVIDSLRLEVGRLQEAEASLRTLLAASPDLVFVFDATGNYLDILTLRNILHVKDPASLMVGTSMSSSRRL